VPQLRQKIEWVSDALTRLATKSQATPNLPPVGYSMSGGACDGPRLWLHFGCHRNEQWRGWMGIEPTQDASSAPRKRF